MNCVQKTKHYTTLFYTSKTKLILMIWKEVRQNFWWNGMLPMKNLSFTFIFSFFWWSIAIISIFQKSFFSFDMRYGRQVWHSALRGACYCPFLSFSLFVVSLFLWFSLFMLLCFSVFPFLHFSVSPFIGFSVSPFLPFSLSTFLYFSVYTFIRFSY